jgi:hypothetical protein
LIFFPVPLFSPQKKLSTTTTGAHKLSDIVLFRLQPIAASINIETNAYLNDFVTLVEHSSSFANVVNGLNPDYLVKERLCLWSYATSSTRLFQTSFDRVLVTLPERCPSTIPALQAVLKV